jgi:hypothetical protein
MACPPMDPIVLRNEATEERREGGREGGEPFNQGASDFVSIYNLHTDLGEMVPLEATRLCDWLRLTITFFSFCPCSGRTEIRGCRPLVFGLACAGVEAIYAYLFPGCGSLFAHRVVSVSLSLLPNCFPVFTSLLDEKQLACFVLY